MYQRDFIMRMIEMIGDLIAGILGLIKKGNYEQASQSLENAYQDFLREDAAFFKAIPASELTNELLTKHNFTNGHLEILSELFYAQAELFAAQDCLKESLEFYEKTLLLLEFVVTESGTYSIEKQLRIAELHDKIAQLKGK
jgi:hypothetical protein